MSLQKKERNYDSSLVDILAQDNVATEINGVPVIIKRIPDDRNGKGNLDCRVLEDVKTQQEKNVGNPNSAINLDPKALPFPPEKLLVFLRMLSDRARKDPKQKKTVDLCQGSIRISKEKIVLGGRKILFWKYETEREATEKKPCFYSFSRRRIFSRRAQRRRRYAQIHSGKSQRRCVRRGLFSCPRIPLSCGV